MKLRFLIAAALPIALLHLLSTVIDLGQHLPSWSALLCFALMPGLGLLCLLRAPARLQLFPAAMVFSLPACGAAFAGLLAAGITAPAASLVTTGIAVLPAVLSLFRRSPTLSLSRTDTWVLALTAVAAVGVGATLCSDAVMRSWHGFFHASITELILNEGVPPNNPAFYGATLNYHWGFHTFIALLTAASGVNPLRVMAAMNVLMLAMTVVAAYTAGKLLFRDSRDRVLVPICLFGAVNTGAGLILLTKFVRHGRLPYDAWSDGHWIDWLSQRAIPHRIWDGRIASFIREYYDISAMATGMCLLIIYFSLWLQWRRGRRRWLLPAICAALLGLVIGYPPLAIAAIIYLPIACLLTWWLEAPGQKRRLAALVVRLLIPVCVLLATGPYLLAITKHSQWSAAASPFLSVGFSVRSVLSSLSPFWLLLPLILAGAICWVPLLRRLPVAMAFSGALVLGLLAICLRMQQNTQYKFIYGLCLFAALFSVQGWVWLRKRFLSRPLWRRTAVVAACTICLHVPVLFVIGAVTSSMYDDASVRVVGRDLVRTDDPARMECLAWVRDETSPDAALVLPLIEDDRSPSNVGFRDPAIARRSAFLVYDVYHSKRFKQYEDRSEGVRLLYQHGRSYRAAEAIGRLVPDRPVFAIIEADPRGRGVPGWSFVHNSSPFAVLALSREPNRPSLH